MEWVELINKMISWLSDIFGDGKVRNGKSNDVIIVRDDKTKAIYHITIWRVEDNENVQNQS